MNLTRLLLFCCFPSLLLAQAPYPLETPTTGDGLSAYYWSLAPNTVPTSGEPLHREGDGPIGADNANAGWADETVYNTATSGDFLATSFNYSGNDLTTISEWLGSDANSFSGEEGILGDAAFRMVGYLRVEEPGERSFTTSSDDGSVVYVNDQLVVSNDNGHGTETVTGTIEFTEPGYYPIDVRYFNGDWTNDAGDHGGATFTGDEGFDDFVTRLEGVEPFYEPPLPVDPAFPIAHYSLDEATGETVLRDVSGRRRDGTFDDVSLGQEGLATGSSGRFSEGAQAVIGGNPFASRNLTVSLWIHSDGVTGTQALVGQGSGAPVYVLSLSEDRLAWFVEEEIDLESPRGLIQPNQTYHVAVTHREQLGQAETVLYIDGQEVARETGGALLSLDSDAPVTIGAYNKNLPFSGRLDDVQFYDRALDAEAIKGLFDEPGSVTNEIPIGELPPGALAGGPEVAGAAGLAGYYWLLDPKEVPGGGNPMHRPDDGPDGFPGADAGWADENVFNGGNDGSFVATTFNYTGNDLTQVDQWLRGDRSSWTGSQGILGDAVFRMVGYLYVDVPGQRSFSTTSDDTSVLYINDERVLSNNTNETVTASVDFPAAGYYPVDIRYYNGDWTNDAGDHGGARYLGQAGFNDFVVTVDGVEPFYVPEGAEVPGGGEPEPIADPIPGGPEIGGAPGLAAYYWALDPKEVPSSGEPLHRAGDSGGTQTGWADDNVYNTASQGSFTAESFDYGGNDLTPVSEWLRGDNDSRTGEDAILGDMVFRMVGYVYIDTPGARTFTTTSDDGSVVYVNDQLIIHNDNGHGPETVTADIDFPKVGYYPIDIRYFNGDWTNDAGDHGGATFLGEGFEEVVTSIDGVDPFYTPPTNSEGGNGDRTNALTAIVVTPDQVALQIPEGLTYDIEYSQDLISWEIIAQGAVGDLSDTEASRLERKQGYYRGRLTE